MIAHGALVEKIAAMLDQAPALGSVPVHRNRLRPFGSNVSAVVVRKVNSEPMDVAPLLGAGIEWLTQVQVECYAAASAYQTPHEAADALLEAAHIAMTEEPTLDGLCIYVGSPRLSWEEADMDVQVACAIARYPIQHRSAPNTLEAAS